MVWCMSGSETSQKMLKQGILRRQHWTNARKTCLTCVSFRLTYVRCISDNLRVFDDSCRCAGFLGWFTYVSLTVTYVRSCLMPLEPIFHPKNVREILGNVRDGLLTYVRSRFTYLSLVQTVINTKLDPVRPSLSFFKLSQLQIDSLSTTLLAQRCWTSLEVISCF